MKKKYTILAILFVLVIIPFNLFAQSSDVFKQDGIASWYGREFEGRPTASGEIFDASQLTAAHPSLPFGTMVIVTNQHNNKSVTVRINDRGPFVPARIIDVSRAAAERLDMIVTGTAPVSIVSIDRIVISSPVVGAQMAPPVSPVSSVATAPAASPVIAQPTPVVAAPPVSPVSSVATAPAAASPVIAQPTPVITAPVVTAPAITVQPAPAPVIYVTQPVVVVQAPVQFKLMPEINIISDKNYRLQVGSFRNTRNAIDAFDKLKNSGLNPAYERFIASDNVEYYRVVVAGVRGTDVIKTTEKIGAAGFREALIREEN